MRTMVTIDDDLCKKALEFAHTAKDKADLRREAIKTFVWSQAAKRVAALGSTIPNMQDVARRAMMPSR